jgi:hypothetical protein
MAQQWAEAAQKGKAEVQIPKQYKEFEEVFSEEVAKHFPPSRLEDHAIKLKPGAPETINCKVYPLNTADLEATKKFVEEHKSKNYIQKMDSPWSMPWFFIKKKDGSLRPIQDYQEVNKWTICDVYPIPCIEQIMEQLKDKKLFTKFNTVEPANTQVEPDYQCRAQHHSVSVAQPPSRTVIRNPLMGCYLLYAQPY